MNIRIGIFSLLLFILSPLSAQDASNRTKAMEIARNAVQVMDTGDFEKAISLLEEAKTLDPSYYLYDYEIAYAKMQSKEYQACIDILEATISNYDSLHADLYQFLGNVYDINKNPEKAIEVYTTGLEKFPNSGKLYFERGVVYSASLNDGGEAIKNWEMGIEKDPAYPSNYFYLAKAFCESEDELWGIIYGEIFMNLEKNSGRTVEMSQILFETYRKGLIFQSKKKMAVSFTQHSLAMSLDSSGAFKFPFGMHFEIVMGLAAASAIKAEKKKVKALNISHLNKIRTQFIQSWFEQEWVEDYPNVLFDWQKKLIEEGLFETYNYWVFMKGQESESGPWFADHEEEFAKFSEWFLANPMPLNRENCFLRTRY